MVLRQQTNRVFAPLSGGELKIKHSRKRALHLHAAAGWQGVPAAREGS